MKIRADFSQRVALHLHEAEWTPSPQAGVHRIMLDRIGEEIARATSFVRFDPGSSFPFHEHGGGEEVFVIDGVFEDEYGRYPAGTYLRDPIGSSHSPFAKDGCTIFVKLWQFAPGDQTRVVIDTASAAWEPTETPGLRIKPLHSFAGVSTSLLCLAAGLRLNWTSSIRAARKSSFLTAPSTTPRGNIRKAPGFATLADARAPWFRKTDACCSRRPDICRLTSSKGKISRQPPGDETPPT